MLENRLFFAVASRSGFGAAISDPVARSSIVFLNSVFADRIVVAASSLLGAAAECVILLSFAAGLRKSYWSGCIQAAKWICQQIFSILAVVIFVLKILWKSASKLFFFCFGVEIRFGAAIFDALALCRSHCNGCVSATRKCFLFQVMLCCIVLLAAVFGLSDDAWRGLNARKISNRQQRKKSGFRFIWYKTLSA